MDVAPRYPSLALMRAVQTYRRVFGRSPAIWFLEGRGCDAELAEAILEAVRRGKAFEPKPLLEAWAIQRWEESS